MPFPRLLDSRFPPEIVLDPLGVARDDAGNISEIYCCKECHRDLVKAKLPPLALANHTYLGPVPTELKDLTFLEEQIVARARAKSFIVHLKEDKYKKNKNKNGSEDESSTRRPNEQRGFKGHIIIHPQRPERLDDILPPTVDDILTPICIIFVGAEPPTQQWLKDKAKPLGVRREKVRSALDWLKSNNHLYRDITIDNERLNDLPLDGLLPFHVEHVQPNVSEEALTDRYDDLRLSNRDGTTREHVEFQKVVITDVDGRAPANELRAAAIRHIKDKGGGYMEVPHDPTPVNEFCNPQLFPMLYPTLFPYGVGGCENPSRRRPLSLRRHIKH
ncbi:hypothetical protein C2E23DRAFT_732212, partial [Lenzites betulinus]